MPRIDVFRAGCLWVAVNVTDHGGYRYARVGFTRDHAYRRCLRELIIDQAKYERAKAN